jgi:hypothetical protein
VTPFSIQKPVKNHFCRLTIQEPIFSVSNTEFEGGDDGHGHGDYTFLVKQAQPSHRGRFSKTTKLFLVGFCFMTKWSPELGL